jgi:hypothetical protein
MTRPTLAQAGASAVALLLLALAGPCVYRSWLAHSEPKPTPPVVDAGTPVAETRPPVTEPLPITRPALTESELRAEAKRFGYVLAKPAKESARHATETGQGTPQAATPGAGIPGSIAASGANVAPWDGVPVKLVEETFKHEASGASVDVAAFYVGPGVPLDLRGIWATWTPPKSETCDSGGLVDPGTGARFRAGVGGIASPQGAGVGPVGGWNYDGFRILGASATADIAAGWSEQSGGVALGMLGVSF